MGERDPVTAAELSTFDDAETRQGYRDGRAGEPGFAIQVLPLPVEPDAPQIGPEIRNALRVALSFMEGFEGDEMQDGIDERIDTVRAALKVAEGVG